MNQTSMGCHVAKLFRLFSAILLIVLMTACGGGGGSAGTVSGGSANQNPNGKITVSLYDANGTAGNKVMAGNVLTARAIVYDKTGAPLKNVIVTFTLNGTLATLAPVSGTALSDNNGTVQVAIIAGSAPGAISVTAAATAVGTTAISATEPFEITAGTNAANPDGKIQLGLVDLNGGPGNLLTSASVLTAKAIVTNNLGAPAVGVVVTFTLDSAIASMLPSTGTALTDANGVAQITLKAGVGTGAGTLTSKATVVGSTAILGTANFSVGSSNNAVPTAVNFVSAVPSDKSIVIKGSGGNGRTEVALLTFSVVDSANVGIANRKVNFTTQSTETVSLVAVSGVTDASGNVTAAVNSGDKPTTVRVVATVDGTSISTISDTVAVTTGLPTQLSFTVIREKNNVEGFDFGNIQNKITVLMADANGGVVANGTPVVFKTDSGAIIGDGGANDTARCLTTLGACSVTWRSQSPNKSVVTVTATATNGSNTLTGTTQFTNSASDGSVIDLPGTVTFTAGPATCKDQNFVITVVDRNGYTMPGGTALSFADATNVTAKIYPDKVVAPTSVNAGGTQHEVTFTPNNGCTPAGVGIGHVYFEVKSPLGISQSYRVSITYN